MRTFREFTTLCEQSKFDKERSNLSVGTRAPDPSRGGRVGADRKKSAPEKTRMKAVGGGKMVPAKDYKARKDIGKQRQASTRVQQPTKERGSARLDPRAAQRKAAMERRAARGNQPTKSKDLERKASQMLTKKKKQTVDPRYKPQKASGYTRAERRAIKRQGDKLVGDIQKGINRPKSAYAVKLGGGKMMS